MHYKLDIIIIIIIIIIISSRFPSTNITCRITYNKCIRKFWAEDVEHDHKELRLRNKRKAVMNVDLQTAD